MLCSTLDVIYDIVVPCHSVESFHTSLSLKAYGESTGDWEKKGGLMVSFLTGVEGSFIHAGILY